MFSFFRRNQKESEQCFIQDNPIDTELSYKNFIERVDDQLIGKAIDEKLLILNYLIDSVEIDMCSCKNNQTISDFSDFRIAVLFTLGKYRREINHRHIND